MKKVKLDNATPNSFYFTVKDQMVRYDGRKDIWTCTCQHEAYRGNKLNQTCYHIKACKYLQSKLREQEKEDEMDL